MAAAEVELTFASLAAARSSGLTLVDIREVRERDADAPEDRIELHVPMGTLLDGSATLPRDGRYLIVCAHGVRSLALAGHLRAQGYPAVYSLVGGLAGLED